MIHEYVAEAGELLGTLVAAHQNISLLAEALMNIKKRLADLFPELAFIDSSGMTR